MNDSAKNKVEGGVSKGTQTLVIKPSGLCRRVDNLGRIVLPKEWRKALGIGEISKDALGPMFEIFFVEDGFYIRRRADLDNNTEV